MVNDEDYKTTEEFHALRARIFCLQGAEVRTEYKVNKGIQRETPYYA